MKEILCRGNHVASLGHFSALSTLKLLDLADNNVTGVETAEIPSNLVVLNLAGNPLTYNQRTLQILSKVKIVNPENICQVSCFQNFKQFALGDTSDYLPAAVKPPQPPATIRDSETNQTQ